MRKRGLAEREPEVEVTEVLRPHEEWNQEEKKFLNESKERETAREQVQRLVPGFEIKRLVL